jgi:hypothetical protein
MADEYTEQFGESTGAQTPEQMLRAGMTALQTIARDLSQLLNLFEGDAENVGLVEILVDLNERSEALDAAMRMAMDDGEKGSSRISARAVLQAYRDVRVAQEAEDEEGA